jgi:hypothetical protein
MKVEVELLVSKSSKMSTYSITRSISHFPHKLIQINTLPLLLAPPRSAFVPRQLLLRVAEKAVVWLGCATGNNGFFNFANRQNLLTNPELKWWSKANDNDKHYIC